MKKLFQKIDLWKNLSPPPSPHNNKPNNKSLEHSPEVLSTQLLTSKVKSILYFFQLYSSQALRPQIWTLSYQNNTVNFIFLSEKQSSWNQFVNLPCRHIAKMNISCNVYIHKNENHLSANPPRISLLSFSTASQRLKPVVSTVIFSIRQYFQQYVYIRTASS